MKRTVLACGGLATDPNPFLSAPQGAMRRAEDVWFKHADVASLRPGFPRVATKSTTRRPRAMHIYDGAAFVVSVDGSTYSLETVGAVLAGNAPTPPNVSISPTQFCEARKNLYYMADIGYQKVVGAGASTSSNAGLKELASGVYTLSSSGTPQALATGKSVGYRAVIVRRDANGVEVRSAPSPWFQAQNAAGATRDVVLSFAIASDVVEGDVIEVYRSLSVTTPATPSDMLYLAVTKTITASDVSVGLASSIADSTPESSLGAELYTNSTREGARSANYPLPAAVALALFAGCVFFGNTTDRQTLAIQFLRTQPNAPSGSSTGVSYAEFAVTGTVGTNTCTYATLSGGLHVGMHIYLTDPDAPDATFPAGTTITGIAGTTLTLSANLLNSPSGVATRASDRVTVGSDKFYTTSVALWAAGTKYFPVYATGDGVRDLGQIARHFAYQLTQQLSTRYAYGFEDPLVAGQVVVRNEVLTAAAFSITTTIPSGAIISLRADGVFTSTAETKPNRLGYTKPDEPEHATVLSFLAIGAENAAILAVKKSRSALLVFKEDGVFKVTGSAPHSWRVDEIDTRTRLLRGSCAAELDGIVYAWTNRGAVAVTEIGVRDLSRRAISRELDAYAQFMATEPATAGAWVVGWPDAGVVLFGVPASEGETYTGRAYCYVEPTGRWSSWSIAAYCAASDRDGSSLWFGRRDLWDLRKCDSGGRNDGITGYDHNWSISAWTYTAGSVLVNVSSAQRGDWIPKDDDWVSCIIGGSVYYRRIVTATAVAAGAYDLTIDSAWPAGAQVSLTAYEGVVAAMEWQPLTAGDPFTSALWRELQVAMDLRDSSSQGGAHVHRDPRFKIGALCERSTGTDPDDPKETSVTRRDPARHRDTFRAGIDREAGRANECAPWVKGSNLFVRWHCRGVSVLHQADSGDAERGTR